MDEPPEPAPPTESGWTAATVFLDVDGRLRAGWRLLLHVPMLILGGILTTLLVVGAVLLSMALEYADPAPEWMLVLQAASTFAGIMIATLLSTLILDARWIPRIWIGSSRGVGQGRPLGRATLEWILGIGVALVAMAVTVGIMALGGMRVELPEPSLASALGIAGFAGVLILAAWFEELLFRGYAFQWVAGSLSRLGRRLSGGRWARIIDVLAWSAPAVLLSAAFGVLHLGNPSATALSTANTVLAGLWFVVLMVRTRSLWPAIAAHWAWNALTLVVLGLPVSGVGPESGVDVPSIVDLTATGPEWLGGGAYGPEGSVGATVGLLVAVALSAVLPRRRPEDGIAAMRALPDYPPHPADTSHSTTPEEVAGVAK